jgi:hypothetical protein
MTKKKDTHANLKIDASFHEAMKRAVNTPKKNGNKPDRKEDKKGRNGGGSEGPK